MTKKNDITLPTQEDEKLLNDVLEVIKNNSLSDADPKDIQSVTERVEKM